MGVEDYIWIAGDGRGVWTVELQCITFKQKKLQYHYLGQQFALCGVSSQPITWHLCVTILQFILLWPVNSSTEWEESWIVGNADFLDINSDALAQPAQDSCVEELRKTGSTKWDMWHLCIWEFFVEILILFVQRMFCNGKRITIMATHSKLELASKKLFFFVFFQCLL